MTDLLFSTPWWLPAILAALGLYLTWDGNRRQDRTLRGVGLAVLGLTVVLLVVSYVVDTDVEKVQKRTKALVAAVNGNDWKTFRSLLDLQTSVAGIGVGREAVATGAQLSAERVGLRNVYVTSMTTTQHDTEITVTINVYSEQDEAPYPVPTNWELGWQDRGDGWMLANVTPVAGGRVDPDAIKKRMVPVK
ncbi:MAG TPA: hypothetical protein VK324_06035 [Tepidisphaeraceae bacterium]|nr:hypothetical protein [Tepidisphaeraceae bacterium]